MASCEDYDRRAGVKAKNVGGRKGETDIGLTRKEDVRRPVLGIGRIADESDISKSFRVQYRKDRSGLLDVNRQTADLIVSQYTARLAEIKVGDHLAFFH